MTAMIKVYGFNDSLSTLTTPISLCEFRVTATKLISSARCTMTFIIYGGLCILHFSTEVI